MSTAYDGRTLYSTTRSTGQIEEGPVGYSITNIDGDVVSWRFAELGGLPVVVIISPSDKRLLTTSSKVPRGILTLRAKFWGEVEAVKAVAHLDGRHITMRRVEDSQVWETSGTAPSERIHSADVSIEDALENIATDEIRVVTGELRERERVARDQDNELEAWPEHGLLNTQLRPNKKGKKW